jgi:hypothetical protein
MIWKNKMNNRNGYWLRFNDYQTKMEMKKLKTRLKLDNELERKTDQAISTGFNNSWPRPYVENKLEELQHYG